MHPNLIDIGFLHLKTYGALVAIGFLAAWQVCSWLCRREGRNAEDLSNLLVLMMAGGIGGARLAYVIEHWQAEFAANPLQIIRIDQGGLMFYGGVIADFIVFALWCRAKRENPLKMADFIAVVVPLGHAFGRIGCFFYGCCYGRISGSVCAVRFPRFSPAWHEHFAKELIDFNAHESLPVLPTQLFEAGAMALLFAVMLALFVKTRGKTGNGLVAGAYLVFYAVWRSINEILRGDPRAMVGGLTIGQTISCVMAAAGLCLIVRALAKGPDRA